MSRYLAFLLIFTVPFLVNAQQSKGIEGTDEGDTSHGSNRALIIGISKYQQIHSLEYADKDAIEFSNFLLTNNAWKIQKDNLVLLTNEKANAGDILTWLSWLKESSKPGDQVVFYFSGHGDVETSADVNKGFLLAYDSPKNNYVTGALSVDILQKAFSDIIAKGARLYIVTDACRSGHLAGGLSGTQQTAKAFSKQWKNETKVLSAQPDEVSYEGKQWGSGRGVFSFFLIKGLSGYADVNRDSTITLSELEQYVGLQVSEATQYKQQPVFEGASKFSSKISATNVTEMERYKQWKDGSDIAVLVVKEKGKEASDTTDCQAYNQLKALLDKGEPDSSSLQAAMRYYNNVSLCASPRYKTLSRYRLTAGLMNYLQQVLNQTLIGRKLISPDGLGFALRQVDNIYLINGSSEIINKEHLDNIRRYLFINKLLLWGEDEEKISNRGLIRRMLDTALNKEPGAAYLLNTKGVMYIYEEANDSAIICFRSALRSSPTWLIPSLYIGQTLERQQKIPEAISLYESVMNMDSSFRTFECAQCFYKNLAELYVDLKKYDKAKSAYNTILKLNPQSLDAMEGMFRIYTHYKDKPNAVKWLEKIKSQPLDISDKLSVLGLEIEFSLISKSEAEKTLAKYDSLATGADRAKFYSTRGYYKYLYKLKGAKKDYELAYEADPSDYDNLLNYAGALIEDYDFDTALEVISDVENKLIGYKWASVQYYKALALLYSDDLKGSFDILKTLIDKKFFTCKEIKEFKKDFKNYIPYKKYMEGCK